MLRLALFREPIDFWLVFYITMDYVIARNWCIREKEFSSIVLTQTMKHKMFKITYPYNLAIDILRLNHRILETFFFNAFVYFYGFVDAVLMLP
jgi:hypothetical protein